jgi:hypothetical protein
VNREILHFEAVDMHEVKSISEKKIRVTMKCFVLLVDMSFSYSVDSHLTTVGETRQYRIRDG